MMAIQSPAPESFVAALSGERARLVRLCARLAGDALAAEDLAQETLFEAWRSREKLRDTGEISPWLAVIARNVCLRWRRMRGREQRLYLPHAHDAADGHDGEALDPLEQVPSEDADLFPHLERNELADLLGRAMELLPDDTREVLVASYLEEMPQRELADRLGLREGALRARLHRGKRTLRRLLEGDLRSEALSWGLVADNELRWQETRIWCPFCGIHHLACWLSRDTGAFRFRCAGACQPGIEAIVGSDEEAPITASLTSPKALLSRQCLALGNAYRVMMASIKEACPACGTPVHIIQQHPEDDVLPPILAYGILIICPRCGPIDGASSWHLALDTPQAIQFWRRHPRMRALPVQTLEFGGRLAIQTCFESRTDYARLEIITARDTLEVLHTSQTE